MTDKLPSDERVVSRSVLRREAVQKGEPMPTFVESDERLARDERDRFTLKEYLDAIAQESTPPHLMSESISMGVIRGLIAQALRKLSEESSAVALAKAGMRDAAAKACDKSEAHHLKKFRAAVDDDDSSPVEEDSEKAMEVASRELAETIRALPDAAADEALARFKADAVREALERFKLLSVAWRAKVEEGTMPTNKEIGYLNCADQIDSLIAELEKEN